MHAGLKQALEERVGRKGGKKGGGGGGVGVWEAGTSAHVLFQAR